MSAHLLFQDRLTSIGAAIAQQIKMPGDFETDVPGLTLHRRNQQSKPLPCIYTLSLAITLQGSKQVLVGDKIIRYGPGEALITTIDLPVVSQVASATPQKPFLGLLITLDAKSLIQLIENLDTRQSQPRFTMDPILSYMVDYPLLDAAGRLVESLAEPSLVKHLAPLILQEINVRLLSGSYGHSLKRLILEDVPDRQIARSISWMKQHYRERINIEHMALQVNMSPSSFRQHFRQITGTSPLQYQKQLRLQEARQLMLNRGYSAIEACGWVGYESASQFSREYKRLFGVPPQKDIQGLRTEHPI